jgi:uncharacterized lipoprotein YddW (UPF0748 family)
MLSVIVGVGATRAAGAGPEQLLYPAAGSPPGGLVLGGAALIDRGAGQAQLLLPGDSYATWSPKAAISSTRGSILLWVKPLWKEGDRSSHTLLTFGWSGEDHSYFALSQGWWEPVGSGRLYAVGSNQDFAFCFTPWTFDYTLFLPGQVTMVAVTWQSGEGGFLRLYVDGRKLCDHPFSAKRERSLAGPIYVGSDRGATDQRQRPSGFAVEDLAVYPGVVSDLDIHRAYQAHGGDGRSKWLTAILHSGGGAGTRAAPQSSSEQRMLFDEDPGWAASRLEIQRRVQRVKAAGFNVYIPCVWDGGHAQFTTARAPMSAVAAGGATDGYDPLSYLISYAHQSGIRVYAWFVVVRRVSAEFPAEYYDGAPQNAFNVQNRGFRDFIVALIGDAIRNYDLDGVNLDYIRSLGLCSSDACTQSYRSAFGASLTEDWRRALAGQEVGSIEGWNGAAVTDIVTRVARAARAGAGGKVISIDTVAGDRERRLQGVDEQAWLHAGLIDIVVHMAYDDPVDIDTVSKLRRAIPADRMAIAFRNYDIFGEQAVPRPGALIADYVSLWRQQWPGSGIAFYHYPHLSGEQIAALGSAFAGPAAAAGEHP